MAEGEGVVVAGGIGRVALVAEPFGAPDREDGVGQDVRDAARGQAARLGGLALDADLPRRVGGPDRERPECPVHVGALGLTRHDAPVRTGADAVQRHRDRALGVDVLDTSLRLDPLRLEADLLELDQRTAGDRDHDDHHRDEHERAAPFGAARDPARPVPVGLVRPHELSSAARFTTETVRVDDPSPVPTVSSTTTFWSPSST
ncbi:MAG: hypothetical protein KatS3mg010_1784 [Acidimicrobiia bacterium]|nr:MAG: hypothetical protein KatS3mg010_1784 [Acidimicrobiia bacterium]